jgi:hypothetical protein
MSDTQCAHQGQLVVEHDLKRLATPKGGGLFGHLTAPLPAWDALICFCRWGRDHNSSESVRPPQYRWTTPEGEERYASVVTCRSVLIERAFLVAALRPLLAKQRPAP